MLFSLTKRIFAKGYGFLCLAKNKCKNISKSLNSTYSQTLQDHAKESATNAFKTFQKKVIQKTAEATSGLIEINLLIKLQVSKSSPQNNSGKNIKKYLRKNICIQN